MFMQRGPVGEPGGQMLVKDMAVAFPITQNGKSLVSGDARSPGAEITCRIKLFKFLPQHDDRLLHRLAGILAGRQHRPQQRVQSRLMLRKEAEEEVVSRVVEAGHGRDS